MKWLIVAYILFQIDSKSKRLAEDRLKIGERAKPVAGGKVMLRRVKNKGLAGGRMFGDENDVKKLVTVAGVLIALGFLTELPRKGRVLNKTGLTFLAAGAAGNLYDRWTRGSVTDFLSLGPEYGKISDMVFNLADVWILAGGAAMIPAWVLSKAGKK